MERLIEKDKDGFIDSGIERNAVNGCWDILDIEWIEKCLERLAEYEETKMAPEDITQIKRDYNKLLKIAFAGCRNCYHADNPYCSPSKLSCYAIEKENKLI